MIHTFAVTENLELLRDLPLSRLTGSDINWYWVDFEAPDEKEVQVLGEQFRFHHLSIEDCLHILERPKVDYYDSYNFFVLHALEQDTFEPQELDIFVGENYVVSFHKNALKEIDDAREKILSDRDCWIGGNIYFTYILFDKTVDRYFPAVYNLEDILGRIDIRSKDARIHNLIEQVFDIRQNLLKLRRTVNSMKELLYRMLNSEHLKVFKENRRYFADVYDHLLKLSDTIESNREITSDMRDSYLSINSHRMNTIMTILTVITTIFIPLTFIVGVYGMNFEFMPELKWRYGYLLVMLIMLVMGISMFLWFKIKGWFEIYK